MSEGFVRARDAAGPWAAVVIDRCHVARASRACAETGRQPERQRLKSARPPAESAALQGAMGPWRTRPATLAPQEWERLARVFAVSPTLEKADHLREDLPDRCVRDDTTAGAKGAMRAWYTRGPASGRAEGERVLGTIDRWMDQITHDGQARQTRGVVEGFNNRVKVLKRRCDGIFDVGRRLQRLTLDGHGDQRFGHT